MPKFRIEQLEKSNFDQIADLVNQLYSELFGPQMTLGKNELSQIQNQWNASTLLWVFCVKKGAETVAFISLAESFSFFAHGKYGIINELWVTASARGEGIGTGLLKHAIDFARKKQWHRLDVSAPPLEEWQRTFEFYEKNEFIWTGKKLKYIIP